MNSLDQLKQLTTVVADTGDFDSELSRCRCPPDLLGAEPQLTRRVLQALLPSPPRMPPPTPP